MIQVVVVIGVIGDAVRGPGLVAELLVLKDVEDGVEAESVHALVQPEDEDVVHLAADLLVAVVQVRLLHDELVQVELLPLLPVFPGGEAETRKLQEIAL